MVIANDADGTYKGSLKLHYVTQSPKKSTEVNELFIVGIKRRENEITLVESRNVSYP